MLLDAPLQVSSFVDWVLAFEMRAREQVPRFGEGREMGHGLENAGKCCPMENGKICLFAIYS